MVMWHLLCNPEIKIRKEKSISTHMIILHIHTLWRLVTKKATFPTTGYDLRFGKPNITTDISGNDMKYTYDGAGRTKTIRAPYELDANVPYTIKFDYWDDHDLPSYSAANIPKWARTSHYDSYDSGNKITTILFTDAMGKVLPN